MIVNKEQTKQRFADYVKNYNINDPKVSLKVAHTYRVADLCQKIAESQNMSKEDVDIAWLSGMLHDVGRFEQVRRFGTFIDSQSVDHAKLGCDILYGTNHTRIWGDEVDDSFHFERGILREFVDDTTEDKLLYRAILNHNAYRIEEGLDERYQTFCHILRDADKVDILRVNIETPLEDIYNCTTEELKSTAVTEEVMECFREGHTVLRSKKKVPVDNVVGHISLTYELVYPKSLELMAEQGYLEKLMHFESDNEKARAQFVEIQNVMHEYLKQNLGR